jgi:hypothetical protein
MGWLMLVVGLALPPLIGWWLLTRWRADVPLTLIGLVSLPMLVWGGALGAKIGPCDVPDCMTSSEHRGLVLVLVALAILLVAFALLAAQQLVAGGLVLAAAEVVAAIGVKRVDTTMFVALLVLAALACGYLLLRYVRARAEARVPDFPPAV